MVDERRVRRLAQAVTGDLSFLRSWAPVDPRDELALSAVKYRFVTAIEGCIDIAHHLAASEGWEPAPTNAEAVRALSAHGVLDRDLADRMAAAVGFRNVLVHQYRAVDDRLVAEHLDELDRLDAYVAAVVQWLDVQRSG